MRLATPAQMRAIDDASVAAGLSAEILMEAAGALAADRIARHPGVIAVVCGPGHNGADGLVIARHLRARGRNVRVTRLGRATSALYQEQVNRWRVAGGVVGPLDLDGADVVVDAIFGVGFRGDLDGEFAEAVRTINAARATRVVIDVPSGLDGGHGHELDWRCAPTSP